MPTNTKALQVAEPAGFLAGKNKIINGDFGIWQRGTSITYATGTRGYGPDRFNAQCNFTSGTFTISQQTFTPGSAPVAGYESAYFMRLTAGSGTVSYLNWNQKIEDARTFAGQTVTVSFWAKASAGITITPQLYQDFGSGGSAAVLTAGTTTSALTTSWVRYIATITLPSISGKTIGTNSNLALTCDVNGATAGVTLDLWGVQLESGSVATPFTTATGTVQGELAACQRYYYRLNAASNYTRFCSGLSVISTSATAVLPFPVTMRIAPSSLEQSGTAANYAVQSGGSFIAASAVPVFDSATPQTGTITLNVASGLTVGQAILLTSNNTTAAYYGWSAEL